MRFALARTQPNGSRLYLGDEDIPTVLKRAAHMMSEAEADARAKTINQYTADPYEVVGVRNEVEE